LPKQMPISCINRNVGHASVEEGFSGVEGRPKWAIPWLEDDPAQIIPQLWVGAGCGKMRSMLGSTVAPD